MAYDTYEREVQDLPCSFPQRVRINSCQHELVPQAEDTGDDDGILSSLSDFVIREGFWLHPLVSRGFILRHASNCNLGLRCLNRQIPHAD